LGAERYGGRNYIYIFAAVAAFFAFAGRRIPKERVGLYLAMFFLGGLTPLIGTVADHLGTKAYYLQLLFSPSMPDYGASDPNLVPAHIEALTSVGYGIYSVLLARYGLRGALDFSKPWRGALLLLAMLACLASGFRGAIIGFGLIVAVLFYLEGSYRTHLLP